MSSKPNLDQMPGHLIRRLQQQSSSVFQDKVKTAGLDVTSVQFAALDTLQAQPGLDQAGLAKRIAYDRATIGGVIKRLEAKGLIRRVPDKEDRRAYCLWLSDAGQDYLARLRPLVETAQDDILPNLDREEKIQFLKLAKKALEG
ncbi:Transcriptional regulator, MarR family [Sulfitobacter noctilucicola]|uniref:DNA-binding MarR family transcriptional regulator n=1 Tax=Sulfitobacter noctilucicola TaxID=1342301 RepID=A0A7W6M8Y8_9RHOB|nr:MarR family transcriptional regulator [Sulfitobacter noctilucicola]KIN64499.1 Transcriptional regulator, MarR family [Sulfitobacter noctilucicola]MBB4174342.1 DNA-binding MarR family transcriptional regulator [Sulfitobacter noctilucicola]